MKLSPNGIGFISTQVSLDSPVDGAEKVLQTFPEDKPLGGPVCFYWQARTEFKTLLKVVLKAEVFFPSCILRGNITIVREQRHKLMQGDFSIIKSSQKRKDQLTPSILATPVDPTIQSSHDAQMLESTRMQHIFYMRCTGLCDPKILWPEASVQ